jgi:hypothetical protein
MLESGEHLAELTLGQDEWFGQRVRDEVELAWKCRNARRRLKGGGSQDWLPHMGQRRSSSLS